MLLPPNASITDVINKLTELEGINQKTELASVIGSPALSTDTVAQQIVKLQDSKDLLANNLTNQGVSSTGSETLQILANKVLEIPTSNPTSGSVSSNATTREFQYYNGVSGNSGSVTVSGLNFKPRRIVLVSTNGTAWFFTEYNQSVLDLTESIRMYTIDSSALSGTINYHYKNNVSGAYVNETSFRMPVSINRTYTWYAYK